jgi:diguanylate cyclase (GGDEF)-like protein
LNNNPKPSTGRAVQAAPDRSGSLLGVILSIAIISAIVLTYLWWNNLQQLIKSNSIAQSSSATINSVTSLVIAVQSAESSERGYLLTGRASFRTDYDYSVASTWKSLHLVKDALVGTSGGNVILAKIASQLNDEIADLNSAVRQKQQYGWIGDTSYTGSSSIIRYLNTLRSMEGVDLQNCVASRTDSVRALAFLASLLVCALTITFAGTGYMLVEQVRKRKRYAEELASKTKEIDRFHRQLEGRNRELVSSNRHLAQIASIDPLTHLLNRRGMNEMFHEIWDSCAQVSLPVSALMIDVDHFKHYNDTYGHAEGDAVLKVVGEIIYAHTRDTDLAIRYGGEEFLVVLRETGLEDAVETAQRLRMAVEASDILQIPVTISVGAACSDNGVQTPEDLVQSADAALYRSKVDGRNRVTAAGEDSPAEQAKAA